jgi:hypothetical protein
MLLVFLRLMGPMLLALVRLLCRFTARFEDLRQYPTNSRCP